MLESIPLDVEDLWIGCFDTSGLTEFSFDRYLSLKSLVLGSNTFWNVTQFELNGLPQLQSIQLGQWALAGDWGDDRKTISDEPYNYKNILTMRSEIE